MAVIRIRDQQGPLQHVYVAAEVEGCELETLIGALHGQMMFAAKRESNNHPVTFSPMGAADSLADAVVKFKAMCRAPAPNPDIVSVYDVVLPNDEAPPSE